MKLKLDEIKYIKFVCYNSNKELCEFKAVIKSVNEEYIIACAKFSSLFTFSVPQLVNVDCICDDGLYKIKTKLRFVQQETRNIFFLFDAVVDAEYQQNREYFRIPAQCNCIFSFVNENTIKSFEINSYNISANGISLFIPIYETAAGQAKITLVIESKKLVLKCRYVRTEKVPGGHKVAYTFIDISNSDRDFISKFCIKKQLEDRRRTLR